MSFPPYSVVIPAYNAEGFIEDALRSVLAQNHAPSAIFVVDDGSSDATVARAQAVGSMITVVSQVNKGPGAATTAGFALVRTPFVATLDADDVWLPWKMEHQLKRLMEMGICAVFGRLVDFSGPVDGDLRGEPYDAWVRSTLVINTNDARDNGDMIDPPGRVGEMIDWVDRLRSSGKTIEMLAEVVACRRIHEHNATRRNRQDLARAFLHVAKKSLDRKREKL